VAATQDALLAAVPVPAALRADPAVASERGWLLAAATLGALLELRGGPAPRGPRDLVAEVGAFGEHLALRVPTAGAEDAELAVVAFDEHAAPIARLRVRALAFPAAVLDVADLRPPLTGALRGAEVVARLGGRPADPASMAAHEDAALAVLQEEAGTSSRPHDDPDPARRVARRILQRLNGMGKWGGYHTEITHLPRGFAPHERELAETVGEALLEAGLLESKPSVGQRHVFLNPRRAGEIHRLIDDGEVPPGLVLPPG
jgi:hypothetical protein